MNKLFLWGFAFFFIISGCAKDRPSSSVNSIEDASIVEGYPKLYDAVLNRDARQILTFTSDSSLAIRQQAWRALAQTPVDSLSAFIEKVKQSRDAMAWFSLSMHKLTSAELRNLENYGLAHPDKRAGVSLVLGQQGDKESLSFLLNHIDSLEKVDD